MKAHKKTKQNLFFNEYQTQSKPNTPRMTINNQNIEHRKLLQYKDYLCSLRKMDLGTLIQQNKSRKTSTVSVIPNQVQKQLKKSGQSKGKLTQQQSPKKSIQLVKPSKVKQISLKMQKPLNIIKKESFFTDQIPIPQPRRNSFQLVLKQGMKQDDLYCDQSMDDIMKNPHVSTPKFIHFNNFCRTQRDYSTNRSSRNRDLSMPSIQERNLSEQSEEITDKNVKNTSRSVSETIKHRKINSSDFSTPLNTEKQSGKKQNSKKNIESHEIRLSLRPETAKEEMNKTFDNSHLFSTYEYSACSKNDSEGQIKKKMNVKITPFEFQADLSQLKQNRHYFSNPIEEPRTCRQSEPKETHKLSLNVTEIVKRINSRQSKSSMSDRSYRKQHQNKNQGNIPQTSRQSHQKMYSEMMKQKFADFLSHQSTLPLKQIHLDQESSKKKNFKPKIKEFKQKQYLMMRLA